MSGRFCSDCGAARTVGGQKESSAPSQLLGLALTVAAALAIVFTGLGAAYAFVPEFRGATESVLSAPASPIPHRASALGELAHTPVANGLDDTPLPRASLPPTPSVPPTPLASPVPTPQPTQAPPQLPDVGQLPAGAIANTNVELNVRTAPDGSLLMTLQPGDRVRIEGTPILIGRTFWYPVVRRQQPGWAAAGADSTAYLELAPQIPGLTSLWDYTGEPSPTTDHLEELLYAVEAADLGWMKVSAGVLYGSTRARIEWFDGHLPAPCYEAAWRAWRQSDIELQKAAQVVFDYLDAYPNGDPTVGRNVNSWADKSIEQIYIARDLSIAGYCGY